MSISTATKVVNIYGELANVIKYNSSRLEEAVLLFSKAMSIEFTPAMQSYWYVCKIDFLHYLHILLSEIQ